MWLGELTIPPVPWLLTWDVKQQNKQTNQAAGQVKILIFLVKIIFSHICKEVFSDAGLVPFLRYFNA